MRPEGRRVFITGGTGGIGRPLVALLRAAGATVTVHDRARHGAFPAALDTVCAALAADPPDILINLAGTNRFSRCEDQPAEDLLALNLLVPIRLAQAVLPAMRARGTGQIVTIGSMVGLVPLPHMSVYAAAKAGLRAFSDALRRELADSGVTVTHVAPRAVATAMNDGAAALVNRRCGVRSDRADAVAARILRAISRDEADVRIGWPERVFALLNTITPALIDKGLRQTARIGDEVLRTEPLQTEPLETETADDLSHPPLNRAAG